jgi:hypothetical protein
MSMPSHDMNSSVVIEPHGASVSTVGRGSTPWSRQV